MKNITIAGVIVLNDKYQVIIICNKGKSLTFPKGHIEEGERSINDTKKRNL